ncbi:glycosyltransferase family 4 protein [Anaerophaga thermohalophila]|uniref:glycosyltransferase family 4 protein n=1 Tax=Anaerophaga thermohalophila TaxID=177400 RepID=UPI0002D5F0B7|nr:glycosyltransferase family 4 protein [Anaerophaga thermohalophila]
MKVLMIIESLRDGGKQRRMVELLRVLSVSKKYEVMVLFLKNSVHYEEIYNLPGVQTFYLERRFRSDPRVFYSFVHEARKFEPDLVHAWGGLPAVVALPYVLLYRKPFVNGMIANSRLKLFSPEWFRVKCTFPFSDVIISNSEIGLKVYKVPGRKKRLIRNGINFDRIVHQSSGKDVRDRLGIHGDKKIVGMVATIDWRKNFPMYVNAALSVLKKRNDTLFFVVGDGPDKEKIEAMVPEEKKHHFFFTGKIRNVEEIVSLFDVGVLASYGEGTSNSLLEYMLFEKPVVATNVFGINEVVEDGVNGYLVAHDNFMEMGMKISKLLDDTTLAVKMGKEGRKTVESRYSIDQMVAGYENIYEEVIRL